MTTQAEQFNVNLFNTKGYVCVSLKDTERYKNILKSYEVIKSTTTCNGNKITYSKFKLIK